MQRFIKFSIFFLFILSSICFGQIKLDIWKQNKTIGKTNSATVTVQTPPRSFESTLPDGTTDVYDFFESQPIKVEFQKGNKFLYKPLCYKSRKKLSFVTFNQKTGWGGFISGSNSEKSYSMLKDVVNEYDPVNEPLKCGYQLDSSKSVGKVIAKTPSVGNLNLSDFYNPLIPINKTCKVYVEVERRLHLALGNNPQTTIDYVTNIMLGVSYIFSREGIDLRLNKLYVWDVDDGGRYSTLVGPSNVRRGNSLFTFVNNIYNNNPTNPESHFRHILTYDNYGGQAQLNGTADGFQNPNPNLNSCHGVTGICDWTQGLCSTPIIPPPNPPTNITNFNYVLYVVSHELGHNLGSFHTHDAFWKNEIGQFIGRIDTCWDNNSSSPGRPSIYPTIMSYCPTFPVVNPTIRNSILLNGFGKLPRWSIRNNLYYSTQVPFNPSPTLPTLSTNIPSSFTQSGFNGGGQILTNGGSNIISKGICYSTNTNPTINSSNVVIDQTSGNSINLTVTGLIANTIYYYRTFATNSSDVGYGPVRTLSTLQPTLATVTTVPINSITNTSARSGGLISNSGGSPIIRKGVCWSTTNPTPTVTNSITNEGTTPTDFTSNLNNLIPSTTYYVRAYVENQVGISYGNTLSFVTVASNIVSFSGVSLLKKGTRNGTISTLISSDGGKPILSKGVCWKLTSLVSESGPPNISNSKTVDGTGISPYTSILSSLSPNVSYTVRAYVTNSNGTFYSNPITFTTENSPNLSLNSVTFGTYDPSLPNTIDASISLISGTSYISLGFFISQTNTLPTATNFTTKYSLPDCAIPCFFPNQTAYIIKGGLSNNTTNYIRAYIQDEYGNYYYSNTRTLSVTCIPWYPVGTAGDAYLATGPTTANVQTGFNSPVQYCPNTVEVGWVCDVWPQLPTFTSQFKRVCGTQFCVGEFFGLTPNTRYNVRGYFRNSNGNIDYGTMMEFTTPSASKPIVTLPSQFITEVTNNSVRIQTSINDYGGSPVDEIGFIWALSPNQPSLSNVGNGSFVKKTVFSPPCTTNCPYTNNLTTRQSTPPDTLLAGATYNVVAYARNSVGVGYSSDDGTLNQFTTRTLPLYTQPITNISFTTATCGGELVNDYGLSIVKRGVVWSVSPNPFNISQSTSTNGFTVDGNELGFFTSNMTNLIPATLYYVKSYAQLSSGRIIYGDQKTFTTLKTRPEVQLTVSQIGPNSVRLTGVTTYVGQSPISNQGFYYSLGGSTQVTTVPIPPVTTTLMSPSINNGGFESGLTGWTKVDATGPNRWFVSGVSVPRSGSNAAFISGNSGVSWGLLTGQSTSHLYRDFSVPAGQTSGNISFYIKGNSAACSFLKIYIAPTSNTPIPNVPAPCSGTSLTNATVIYKQSSFFENYTLQTQQFNLSSYSGTSFRLIISYENNGTDNPPASIDDITLTCATPAQFTTVITGLTPQTQYSATAFVASSCSQPNPHPNICSNITSCCVGLSTQTFTTLPPLPTAITNIVTNISANSATLNGQVTQGLNITNRGFEISKNSSFPVGPQTRVVNLGSGLGSITTSWTNTDPTTLTPPTYYVRAFGTNSSGTGYGNVVPFVLEYTPSVKTTQPIATSSISGVSGGIVVSNGVTTISQRGVVFSTNQNPTFSPGNLNQTNDGTGLGTFNSVIQNLSPNMTYYVRAYANSVLTTSQGTATYTGYGEELSFKTLPIPSGGNCNIEKTLVVDFEKVIPQGIRWKFTFQPRALCGSYKVELSRYNGNPTTNPSLLPIQTQVLNGMNPYYVTSQEILDGKIFRYMSPQPTNTTTQPIWYSVNVICNTTICPNSTLQDRTVKVFFLVSPP